MRTKRWIQWTAWCGLVLMGMFAAMQVEAQRGGGRGGGGGGGLAAVEAAAFPGAVVPVAGASVVAVGEVVGEVSCGGFFSERCRQ